MSKILFALKLPFLAVREVLILVLKYGYGCRVEVPYKKNKWAMKYGGGNKQWGAA